MSGNCSEDHPEEKDPWFDRYEKLESEDVFWKAWLDPATEAVVVRIATFDHCACAEIPEKHYSIQFKHDDVTNTSAAAISYIWGDHDRQEYQVGHVYDNPTHHVSMYLGKEWDKVNFPNRLVQLSQEYGGCWIDQFCTPQRDDKIREALAKVPSIYKSLRVVIIWPGSLCRCLKDALDEWIRRYKALSMMPRSKSATKIHSPRFREIEEEFEKSRVHLLTVLRGYYCFNSCGANSWTSRIWPNQEFRYANRMRLVFADPMPAPCARYRNNQGQFDWESLSAPLGSHIYKLYKEELPPEKIADGIKSFCWDFAGYIEDMLMMKFTSESDIHDSCVIREFEYPECFNFDSYETFNRLEAHARFLLGEAISIETNFDVQNTFNIMDTCGILGAIRLRATQPKDLIVSVWSGSRHYRLPHDHINRCPRWLLCEVLKQIAASEPEKHLFIPTCRPAGLFGKKQRSAEWHPDVFMPAEEPKDTRELYGPFLWFSYLWIENKPGFNPRIPLQLNHSKYKKKIFLLDEVDAEMRLWPKEEIITRLGDMLEFLGVENVRKSTAKLRDASGPFDLREYLQDLEIIRNGALLDLTKLQGIDLMFTWRTIRDVERSNSGNEEKLVWKDTLVVGLVNTESLHQVRISQAKTVTIASRLSRWNWIYETVNVRDDEYSVLGIWLPSRATYPAWERFEDIIEDPAEAFLASTNRGGYMDKFVQSAWLI